jgi:hypothetical protein
MKYSCMLVFVLCVLVSAAAMLLRFMRSLGLGLGYGAWCQLRWNYPIASETTFWAIHSHQPQKKMEVSGKVKARAAEAVAIARVPKADKCMS